MSTAPAAAQIKPMRSGGGGRGPRPNTRRTSRACLARRRASQALISSSTGGDKEKGEGRQGIGRGEREKNQGETEGGGTVRRLRWAAPPASQGWLASAIRLSVFTGEEEEGRQQQQKGGGGEGRGAPLLLLLPSCPIISVHEGSPDLPLPTRRPRPHPPAAPAHPPPRRCRCRCPPPWPHSRRATPQRPGRRRAAAPPPRQPRP